MILQWGCKRTIALAGLLSCLTLSATKTLAQTASTLELLVQPLDIAQVNQFRLGEVPAEGVVTENTISQSGLTVPSLWWAEEQFGGNLLDYWVAYPGDAETLRRVDLMVNPQIWTQYNYLERYAFLSRFGSSASDFGYNTRVFNWQGDLLAAYICDFESIEADLSNPDFVPGAAVPLMPSRCRVFLDATGARALRGVNPAVPLPTNLGTGQ